MAMMVSAHDVCLWWCCLVRFTCCSEMCSTAHSLRMASRHCYRYGLNSCHSAVAGAARRNCECVENVLTMSCLIVQGSPPRKDGICEPAASFLGADEQQDKEAEHDSAKQMGG